MQPALEGGALRLAPGRALLTLVVAAGVAFSLTYVYRIAAETTGWTPWIAAATVHSAFAVLVVVLLVRRSQTEMLQPMGAHGAAPAWIKTRPLVLYAPAVVIAVGAGALALVSRAMGTDPGVGAIGAPESGPLAWILWIPVVEELVFRAGISPTLRRLAGPIWGAWFAAAVFALAHGGGALVLPLGPFLLGLACEALVGLGGRIGPAIALHAACNGTVAVFVALDPRWLDWLGFLYGRG